MKTFTTAALIVASFALATSASAHQSNRADVSQAVSGSSVHAASAQDAGHDGRFVVATTGDATGGPSGGPNQNGG